MKTEYQRTIEKSAERQHCSRSPERHALEFIQQDAAYNDAYGNLTKPAPKVNLSQAALVIPSFQRYAEQITDIEQMEQELLQKQLLRSKCQAKYEKICATRVRTVQQKVDKEQLET